MCFGSFFTTLAVNSVSDFLHSHRFVWVSFSPLVVDFYFESVHYWDLAFVQSFVFFSEGRTTHWAWNNECQIIKLAGALWLTGLKVPTDKLIIFFWHCYTMINDSFFWFERLFFFFWGGGLYPGSMYRTLLLFNRWVVSGIMYVVCVTWSCTFRPRLCGFASRCEGPLVRRAAFLILLSFLEIFRGCFWCVVGFLLLLLLLLFFSCFGSYCLFGPGFGEGFPQVSEMRVVFGDVHPGDLFVIWSFCDELFAFEHKGFKKSGFGNLV